MIHAADCRVTQHFNSSDAFECEWTKHVIDPAIVDCGIAGSASEVAKVAEDVAVRFAVVFEIVGIKIRLVGGFELEVEISRDKNFGRLRSHCGPIC